MPVHNEDVTVREEFVRLINDIGRMLHGSALNWFTEEQIAYMKGVRDMLQLQRNDGVDRDAWGNPKPQEIPGYAPGHIVEVDRPADPDHHEREGVITATPYAPDGPFKVRFNVGEPGDHEADFVDRELWPVERSGKPAWVDPTNFPPLPDPSTKNSLAATTTCDAVTYPHPYHIRPRSFDPRQR